MGRCLFQKPEKDKKKLKIKELICLASNFSCMLIYYEIYIIKGRIFFLKHHVFYMAHITQKIILIP